MPRKSFLPLKIIAKLRQIEVLTSQGQSVTGGGRHLGCRAITAGAKSMGIWA